jgi:hypothetical protein
MKEMLFTAQKTSGKTITLNNMQTNNLDALIQAAAQQQTQELRWIHNVYQQRLKDLMEMNERYQEYLLSKDANLRNG